jgi:hypothetical protein
MDVPELRKIYRANRITLQKLKWYPGPPRRSPIHEQQKMINIMQSKFKELLKGTKRTKYEIMQMDASIFSAKKYDDEIWARSG